MSNLFICRSYSGIFTAVSELMIASITTCKLACQGRLISKPTVKPTVPAAEAEALQRCLRVAEHACAAYLVTFSVAAPACRQIWQVHIEYIRVWYIVRPDDAKNSCFSYPALLPLNFN